MRELTFHGSTDSNENWSGFKLFENARESPKAHKSAKSAESCRGRTRVADSARESQAKRKAIVFELLSAKKNITLENRVQTTYLPSG